MALSPRARSLLANTDRDSDCSSAVQSGEHSRSLLTSEISRVVGGRFRQAQLHEVTDATALVAIDRPDTVVSAVRDVLAKSHT
jgi:hypothetical protein